MEQIQRAVKRAVERCKNRATPKNKRETVYWWTEEVAIAIRERNRARRKLATARKRNHDDPALATYREQLTAARAKSKRTIETAKKAAFSKLIEEADSDVWGTAYQLVTKRLGKRPPATLTEEATRKNIDHLFPRSSPANWPSRVFDPGTVPPVTLEEVRRAANRIKTKKAPGPDGIPPEAIKILVQEYPEAVALALTKLMKQGEFHGDWKMAELVLIPKPGRNPEELGGVRPICLLSTMGKLVERILVNRLETALRENNAELHEHQFGFREGRSTIDAIRTVLDRAADAKILRHGRRGACLVVALDVRNAFNTARWENIVAELEARRVPGYLLQMIQAYFTDRFIQSGKIKRRTTMGVPQGSVLGPLLWNIQYDGVLRLRHPEGVTVVGFADDIIVTANAYNFAQCKELAVGAIDRINEWMGAMGLSLEARKTKVCRLSGRMRIPQEELQIEILGNKIKIDDQVKYLGLWLDRNGSFVHHIKIKTADASTSARTLAYLMPKVGGGGDWARRLWATAHASTILYGAPIWATPALKFGTNRMRLNKAQRPVLLSVTRANRTVSTEALQVLGKIMPLDLQAMMRRDSFGKEEAEKIRIKEDYIDRWQDRWTNTTNGSSTREVIPDIRPWLNCQHTGLRYELVQFLTGHGTFGKYLHRIGRAESPHCGLCGLIEDAGHVLTRCPKHAGHRCLAEEQLGTKLSPKNFVNVMLESRRNWDIVSGLCRSILMEIDEVFAARSKMR